MFKDKFKISNIRLRTVRFREKKDNHLSHKFVTPIRLFVDKIKKTRYLSVFVIGSLLLTRCNIFPPYDYSMDFKISGITYSRIDNSPIPQTELHFIRMIPGFFREIEREQLNKIFSDKNNRFQISTSVNEPDCDRYHYYLSPSKKNDSLFTYTVSNFTSNSVSCTEKTANDRSIPKQNNTVKDDKFLSSGESGE